MKKDQAILNNTIETILPFLSYGATSSTITSLDGTWREIIIGSGTAILQGFSLVMGTYRIPKTGFYEVSYGGSIYSSDNEGGAKIAIIRNSVTPISDTIVSITLSNSPANLTSIYYTKIISCDINDYIYIAIKRDDNISPVESLHLEGFTFNIKSIS